MGKQVKPNVGSPPRVLALATHPIQYQAPWFRALASSREIEFSVLFVQQLDARQQGTGFGVPFEWDIPLLEGYRWQLAPDVRGAGGLDGFFATRIHRPLHLLRQLKPAAVLLTGWQAWPLFQLLLAALWAGVPVIMRGESNALRRRPWYTRLLHKLLLNRCTAFLPIGKANRSFYQGYGIADRKLFDAPYFVENARFATAAAALMPQRSQLRSRWGIPSEAMCVCYAGKLERKKRILDLLAALRVAGSVSPRPLHLLIVGTGELQTQAQAVVTQHGLPVTFAGFLNQSEISSAYVAADCLALPSDYGETWGLVVNEAMACGRPAIVSDRVGCGPDLVIEGVTGTVFPFGDIEAFAARLVDFAADMDRVRTMGEQARAHVLQGYSVDNSVAGTLQAVRHVLGPA
jgi:glycosyltransferase involved in cell wall biosynthesis